MYDAGRRLFLPDPADGAPPHRANPDAEREQADGSKRENRFLHGNPGDVREYHSQGDYDWISARHRSLVVDSP
jgi:hypothetical protein